MIKEITKSELEKRYNSTKNEVLAQELGISKVTLMSLIKKANIKTKGSGNSYSRPKIKII